MVRTQSAALGQKIAVSQERELTAVELVETAFREAKELVTIEVALAKDELSKEVKATATAATGFAVAGACVVVMLALLGMALVLVLGGTPLIAAAVAGGFLVLALVAAVVGYSLLPKKPLARTRQHLTDDLNQLREHVA